MELTNWLKSRHESATFFIVTIFVTWIIWLPMLLIKNFGAHFPLLYDVLKTVGTFVPSVSGFIFAYTFGGKAELCGLFKSLLDIHIRPKWLLFIFFVLPGVSAVSCLIFFLLGNSLPPMQFTPWFIPVAFVYILVFMGPLGEEAGWRGFALKRLLRCSSPLKASVLLGVAWSIWHLPLFFIEGTTQNALTSFGIFPSLIGYFLYTVMISFLITLLYIMSSGSVLGSVLLHTMGNLSLGIVPLIFSVKGALILLLVLCVVTIFFIYKYRKFMFGTMYQKY